jgi:C1A family cysteine protease
MDVISLQQIIDRVGARWRAVDTQISTTGVRPGSNAFLGVVLTETDRLAELSLATATETIDATAPPPRKIDWRSNNGNYITPVRMQGSCGSCVSFGVCATLEARSRISARNPDLQIELSEAHLFSCGCGNCCSTGWNNAAALNFARGTGIGKESDFPYQPGDQPCKRIAAVVKVPNFTAATSIVARKQAIALRGPVCCSMNVFEYFTYYGG